ncbi:MAG: MATE family efflux transporter [Treponema sp.]|nr:MATE family efflux transporter [Treponema sp.]
MADSSFDLSVLLEKNPELSFRERLDFVWKLSIPGVMAQISSIIMQYIDAAMVGALGADASAAIGLVASSTWVLGSLSHALAIGFTVQVAHAVGAGEKIRAKKIFVQGIYSCFVFSLLLMLLSCFLSRSLPVWLGAETSIMDDAAWYFLIYGLSSTFFITVYLMSGMLQCTGNMKFPAFMNASMCVMDIIFNYLFIFVFKLGVKGAALGTGCSAVVTAIILSVKAIFNSDVLRLFWWKRLDTDALKESLDFKIFSLDFACIKKALKIGLPIGVESSAFTGALVIVARMIAPLGSVALSANSFATTAEALCYMPGYGIQEAAITLVGQSVGAKRKDLTKSFSIMTVCAGMIVMTLMGILMYFICPFVFRLLTPNEEIRMLATKVLRMELFAEPLYAAAIVASGALRGKGDTLVPSLLTLFSLWGVRLVLSVLLIPSYGLMGVWFAMTVELCFRGLILLLRLFINLETKTKAKGKTRL